MVDLTAKTTIIWPKTRIPTCVHKIQHDMQNPDTDRTQDWDDQAVINEQNDVRKTH